MTATDFVAATRFLYTGSNARQHGVAAGAIAEGCVSVLRGRVQTREGQPVSGVEITILNHPEYGLAQTRADGLFDVAVNGGGALVVTYRKSGYLQVQRQIVAPWHDYAWLNPVTLIALDGAVTPIDLTSSQPMQVARGSIVTDGDGARRVTLLFPHGTTATMRLANGTMQPLSSLHVRMTEYTVGASGRQAMPGTLPPSSGYSYALEYTVDEAQAAGATEVRFNRPVISYVEGFLDLPVGITAPVGYYDRARGVWVPSDDGRVIKLLNVTGGLANFDIDGTGNPASAAALAALGVTDPERQQIAKIYSTGQRLWRVPIPHFSPFDT